MDNTTFHEPIQDSDTDAIISFSEIQDSSANIPNQSDSFFHKLFEYENVCESRSWLEETASSFQSIETRVGYWPFTRKQHEINSRKKENLELVSQLDPDAPSRQKRNLAVEDQEYERFMLRTLYEHVRRGNLKEAIMLCVNNGEPWRAASLRGGIYFFDTEIDEITTTQDDNPNRISNRKLRQTGGNINRSLWKEMCSALSTDTSMDTYERALYAALCGRLDEVIEVCVSWEDRLWAEINSMIENQNEKIFQESQSIFTMAKSSGIRLQPQKTEPAESIEQVFSRIKNESSPEVKMLSLDPFREIQTAIICNTLNETIISYSEHLRENGKDSIDLHILRFLVHLVLVLNDVKIPIDQMAGDTIISAYTQRLASSSHKALVAMYSSKLPGSMPDILYSEFLSQLESTTEARAVYIQLAEQYKLNIVAIAKNTALKILEKYTSEGIIDNDKHLREFVLTSVNEPLTKAEMSQVQAIEWLTFHQELYTFALVQAVSLARRFLLRGRMNAAVYLFNSLPEDFVQDSWKKATIQGDFDQEIVSEKDGSNLVDKSLKQIKTNSDISSQMWGKTLSILFQDDVQNSFEENRFGEYELKDSSNGDNVGKNLSYTFSKQKRGLDPSELKNINIDVNIQEDIEVQQWPTVIITTSFHEYIQLLSLCDGIISYYSWCDHMNNKPLDNEMLKVKWMEWRQIAIEMTDDTEHILRDRVLEANWLGTTLMLFENVSSPLVEQRNMEIERLRRLYVPECLYKLHNVLYESRIVIPSNLGKSLDLAQLVADDSLMISRELLSLPVTEQVIDELPNAVRLLINSAEECGEGEGFPRTKLDIFLLLLRQSSMKILEDTEEGKTDGLLKFGLKQ
ncbi:hypothetical protein BB558_003114 [Smittium angustum]|uniref:Nuclear pore complex protein n=1 Tax=Smittium angustum TaxID=133377 RepID=A0A2U1J6U2_SMIAN|nr:hypothetical protein BB558_003114 [Smittium angustum]